MNLRHVLVFAALLTVLGSSGLGAFQNPKGDLNDLHEDDRGHHMHIVADPSNDQFYEMFLTNESAWEDVSGTKEALSQFKSALKITEPSRGDSWIDVEYERGAYNLSLGSTINPNSDERLRDMFYGSRNTQDLSQGNYEDIVVDGDYNSNKNCGHNACEILNNTFNEDTVESSPDDLNTLDVEKKIEIAQGTGDPRTYMPQGQVIKAYEPNTSDNEGLNGEGPFFYICREKSEGMIVDTGGGDTTSGLQICENSPDGTGGTSYQWENSVNACEDGLDNDGDGAIDRSNDYDDTNDDPECNSSNDNREDQAAGGTGDANEGEPIITTDTSLYNGETDAEGPVALFDGEETESGVTYYEINETIPTADPVTYTCNSDGTLENYNAPLTSVSSDMRADAEYHCSQQAETHGDNIQTVQYIIPPEIAASDRFNDNNLIDGYGEYSNEGEPENGDIKGIENWEEQTIHEAEAIYAETVEVTDSNDPHSIGIINTEDGINYYESTKHNDDSWTSQNLPQRFIDGYMSSTDSSIDTEQIRNNWAASNPTQNENDKVRGEFSGGFAPDCQDPAKWSQGNDNWNCELDTTEINLNLYNRTLPANDESMEGNYGGVEIPQSKIQKWNDVYPTGYTGGDHADPVMLRLQCWVGSGNHRDGAFFMNTTTYVNTDSDTVAAFSLNERLDTPDTLNQEQYTCIWGFSQRITSYKPSLQPVQLYTQYGTLIEDANKESHLDSNSTYIIEGINDRGRITSNTMGTIRPGGRTNGTKQEEWLQDNTDVFEALPSDYTPNTPEETDKLWSMFPKGGESLAGGSGRHPGENFKDELMYSN